MKTKDALVGLILWIVIITFMFDAGMNVFEWIGAVIALLAWIMYVVVVFREKKKRPVFWIELKGEWRAIDSDGNLLDPDETSRPNFAKRRNQEEESL